MAWRWQRAQHQRNMLLLPLTTKVAFYSQNHYHRQTKQHPTLNAATDEELSCILTSTPLPPMNEAASYHRRPTPILPTNEVSSYLSCRYRQWTKTYPTLDIATDDEWGGYHCNLPLMMVNSQPSTSRTASNLWRLHQQRPRLQRNMPS